MLLPENYNDRAGAELRNQTTTAQNVSEGKAPDEYGALAGLDAGANQLYGLSDQRYLNRLFQHASENGGYSVKHYQQGGQLPLSQHQKGHKYTTGME